MSNKMSQAVGWEISGHKLYPELRIVKGGRLYSALMFTDFGPADEAGHVYGPGDVEGVEVVETWAGGGSARVTFAGGATKETIFGRRKPGTRGARKRGTGGLNRRRQRNWRAAYCNEMERDVTTPQMGEHA